MNRYLCPVCAYPALEALPQDFSICPCCGTEFDADDFGFTPDEVELARRELRWRWLENGAAWFDPGTTQPPGWNGYDQVLDSPFSIERVFSGPPTIFISAEIHQEANAALPLYSHELVLQDA